MLSKSVVLTGNVNYIVDDIYSFIIVVDVPATPVLLFY